MTSAGVPRAGGMRLGGSGQGLLRLAVAGDKSGQACVPFIGILRLTRKLKSVTRDRKLKFGVF